MPGGQQCPFCQLLENPEQTFTVHETDDFRAWLDINPRAKGHTMIVPKEHIESAEEVGGKLTKMFDIARIVGEKAMNGLGAAGYSVVVNNHETAGQNVPHFYMMVFPRFEDEENAGTPAGAFFRPQEDLEESDLQEFQEAMEAADYADYSGSMTTSYDEAVRGGDAEDGDGTDGDGSGGGFDRRDPAEFR